MENMKLSIDLLKFDGAVITEVNGLKSVVIPMQKNDLLEYNRNGGFPSVYLNLTAWQNNNVGRFGDTHMVKQDFSQKWTESHPAEETKMKPILGNGKIFASQRSNAQTQAPPQAMSQTPPQPQPEGDDLPF